MRLGRIAIASLVALAVAAPPVLAHEFKPPWGYAYVDDRPFHDPVSGALLPKTQVYPRGLIRDVRPPDDKDVRITALVFKPNSSTPSARCVAAEGDFVDLAFGCRIDIAPDEVAYVRYGFCRFTPQNGPDEDCQEFRIDRPQPTPTPTPTPRATPTPAPRPVDRDGDGSPAGIDCSDVNHTVHPGAKEIAGNEIDDDCAGGDAPGRLPALIKYKWETERSRTRALELRVLEAPPGAKVEVVCAGKRCPFKSRTTTANAKGNAHLLKFFRKRLRARLTIDVRVTHGNSIGRVWRFKTRRGDSPPSMQRLCLPAGQLTPGAC